MDKSKLPCYELTLADDSKTGVYCVGLVDFPAIEVDWMKFNKTIELQKETNIKYELVGPFMIPNQLILRESNGEYFNVTLSVDTIKNAMIKYQKSGFNRYTSDNHQIPLYGNTVIESWIIEDENNDKSKMYGYNLPVGTWMIKVKIEDKKYWDEYIATGKRKGFSIESIFDDILLPANSPITEIHKKNNKNQMNKVVKLQRFAGDWESVTGEVITVDVDNNAKVVDKDGQESDSTTSDYITIDGYRICLYEGMLVKVEALAALNEIEDDMEDSMDDSNYEDISDIMETEWEDINNNFAKTKPKKKLKKNNRKRTMSSKLKEIYSWIEKGRKFGFKFNTEVALAMVEYTTVDGEKIVVDETTMTKDLVDADGNKIGTLTITLDNAQTATTETTATETSVTETPATVTQTETEVLLMNKVKELENTIVKMQATAPKAVTFAKENDSIKLSTDEDKSTKFSELKKLREDRIKNKLK